LFIKWTVAQDFQPSVFLSINTTWGPDSRAKAALHMASYSPKKIDNIRTVGAISDLGETISAGSLTPPKRFQFFKGNIPQNYFIGKYTHTVSEL
jgi:hypothetical protein